MATIVLQAAGAAIGGLFGPVGAVVGQAVGTMAGSAVDQALFSPGHTVQGARLSDARFPGAEDGTAITRAYGTVRVGGTLIWATRFEEDVTVERRGGKGAKGTRVETFSYFANIAVGLCEGEIAGVRRVWADGRELDLDGVDMRVYRGTADQLPDPLIVKKQGADAPAFRGLAYVVFDRLPLAAYGNRLPLLQFEVLRPVGRLERDVRAITIIPGASEHGYNPGQVRETPQAGSARLLNRNVFHAHTDWEASIDELQALCPNLKRVALVVSWFGTDLRAGHCCILPGVETRERPGESAVWSVDGQRRDVAYLVSMKDNAPAYGGTPSDDGVVAAIRDLKRRGLEVYLYPFIMMDVPGGNTLPNPYGGPYDGVGQPAYPWRGRITCDAAGDDGTTAVRAQIDAFVKGRKTGEGYRRLVLHYAALAKTAGGVSGFIIGSEMRGLTRLRDAAGAFPFVEALQELAGVVRAELGAGTKLTYAADWSEYSCYQPQDGSGDLLYPLDALWASPHIDAVGIDNYMPLADWRDGDLAQGNPDGFLLADDSEAMARMISAGEGFDWYYATDEDRSARRRTPITDGMAGKPWVYRYKDLENWWSQPHYERRGGREMARATRWPARGKPIWFTELGCPAIDNGANQPNVFMDPKSSESMAPYHSHGNRSDAMQRRFLQAHLSHWAGRHAPAGMVDPDHIFLWTWDARPAPAFPQKQTIWSDGGNWHTGHWLNGRLGAGTLADIVAAVLADHGVDEIDTSLVSGDLTGYVQGEQASARAVLEPLMAAFQLDAVEDGGRLRLRSRLRVALSPRTLTVLAEKAGQPLTEETRGQASDLASEAILESFNAGASYERMTARSRRVTPANERVIRLSLSGVLHEEGAAGLAESALRDNHAGLRTVRFSLPPNAVDVQPGDVVRLEQGPNFAGHPGLFVISRVDDGQMRDVEARSFLHAAGGTARQISTGTSETRDAGQGFAPVVHLLDLPQYEPGNAESFARFGVFARPWRPVMLSSSLFSEGFSVRATASRPARTGTLAAPLVPGVTGRFDRINALMLDLHFGALESVSPLSVRAGENRIAVSAGDGRWEIIGFCHAEETAPGRWMLTGLLRGLAGTEDAMGAATGAPVVVLDRAVQPMGLTAAEIGQSMNWTVDPVGAASLSKGSTEFTGGIMAHRPLSPVHLRLRQRAAGDVEVTWIRRARVDADHWLDGDIALDEAQEAYRVEVLDVAGAVRRVVNVTEPRFLYGMTERRADFGVVEATVRIRVRQKGAKVALGAPAERAFTLPEA